MSESRKEWTKNELTFLARTSKRAQYATTPLPADELHRKTDVGILYARTKPEREAFAPFVSI